MMFIKCDTVKIRTNYKYLKETKIKFNVQYNSKGLEQGICFNSKYHPDMPFNLYISTNNSHQTLEIEFSSKVLKERYPELITRDTIRQCLNNINDLGICTIDVNGILCNGWVIKADVTQDIELNLTNDVLNAMNQNVENYRRYKWQYYKGKGITFTKEVKYCKEEIKVYNKYEELLSHSRKFIDSLENRNEIMDYFWGKTRFEVTLKSESQIRERLGVSTSIKDFFNSLDTVVREQFDRVFDISAKVLNMSELRCYDEWTMACILELFNGDLKKIEQSLRTSDVYSSRNGLLERMKKIQSVKARLNRKENDILREIYNLL